MQLVQHDRERRGDLARQLAGVALDLEPDAALAGRDRLLDHAQQRLHDVAELDLLAGLPGERLVHDRDRADPALGLLDRLTGLG